MGIITGAFQHIVPCFYMEFKKSTLIKILAGLILLDKT